MAWVKRSGGAGTGMYGRGLAALVGKEEPAPAPVRPDPEPTPPPAEPTVPSGYRTTEWPDVRSNRISLEVIASWANEGNEGWTSKFYGVALEALGPESPHLTAACRGDTEAGNRYQQIAAGGRYRTRNGEYWQG